MSVEEDIGGLKADMRTVKDQTSKIFEKMDALHSTFSGHAADSNVVAADVDAMKPVVEDYKRTKNRVIGIALGMGGLTGTAAAWLKDLFTP